MKLRFRDNSLRLRVNRREVQALAAGTALAECVYFPGGSTLSYTLEPADHPGHQASFEQGRIHVYAPTQEVRQWASSEAIGLYFELPAGETQLRIAVEKDLECVEASPDEYDPEAFPRESIKNC